HDRHVLPPLHGQVDAVEGVHLLRPHVVDLEDLAQIDERHPSPYSFLPELPDPLASAASEEPAPRSSSSVVWLTWTASPSLRSRSVRYGPVTTTSPALTPEVSSTRVSSERPVSTVRWCALPPVFPPVMTKTTLRDLAACPSALPSFAPFASSPASRSTTAWIGTVRVFGWAAVRISARTDMRARRLSSGWSSRILT